MLANKNPRAIVGPLEGRIASLSAVPIAGSDSHVAPAFGENARQFDSVEQALRAIPEDGLPILIAGSLYLAGEVLRANEEIPD
jgi:dihydrofolate synthase/folylpolyglutamate synthase